MTEIDEDYYVKVSDLMEPRCRLPRPNRKRLLTGDGEYLPLITWSTGK